MARKTKKKKVAWSNQEYTLPEKSGLKQDTVRYLALDPGIKNFGIAVVAARGNRIKVMANSIVTNPMNDMTKFEDQRDVFLAEIGRWVDLYQPGAIIAERFMVRGSNIGRSMGELVACMITSVSMAFGLPTWPIPAAQWKVPLQRRFDFDLKEMYKQVMTEPHPLDAAFIGIYGLEKRMGIELEFTPEQVMLEVEDSSRLPLKNRKRRS